MYNESYSFYKKSTGIDNIFSIYISILQVEYFIQKKCI